MAHIARLEILRYDYSTVSPYKSNALAAVLLILTDLNKIEPRIANYHKQRVTDVLSSVDTSDLHNLTAVCLPQILCSPAKRKPS